MSTAPDPGSAPAALVARGLTAGYGPIEVLHDLELELRHGELVALLGPNGAGKTTLLLALAGFLKPRRGHVELFGEECRLPAHQRARRGLGYIGEDRHVFPTLTVRQNLRLVANGFDEAIELFPELREHAHKRAALLSGGEQQMLALGRALAAKPRVLLVDELSLGLAPLVRERLLRMLRESADAGAAVLVVEQSVRAVLQVADRALVLRRGDLVDSRVASGWSGKLDELGALFLS